jgi:heterodisulfide reductase subunit A-like polyferredoxin
MTQFPVNIASDKDEFDPEHWTNPGANNVNRLPARHPETGISVLIVGAGMGGLMTALECWRKGHTVVGILERNEGPVYSGTLSTLSSFYSQTRQLTGVNEKKKET